MDNNYQPNWNSLKTHPTPQWFKDAKFGIYTHWGVYCVPGYGPNATWYPYNMYREGEPQYEYHLKTYGHPSRFGYKDFIPMLTAEKFDPDEWAELFKSSGAQFAGPVGEHHDGFCMWDTGYSDWSAAKMGPKRDVVGLLEKSIRRVGMRFMVALHHAENWWFYPHWRKEFDTSDPRYAGLYGEAHNLDGNIGPDFFDQDRPSSKFMQTWLAKAHEVVDKYQPDLMWFDNGIWGIPEQYRLEFLAYYYNKEAEWGRSLAVTFKNHELAPGSAVVDIELGRMGNLTYFDWITDTTVDDGRGWGYLKDTPYKSTTTLVHYLVDNVSKNGAMLLNIGPRPDGTLPEQAQDLLKGMGKWLAVNGEAIYGTTCWMTYGEGPTKIRTSGEFNEKKVAPFTPQDIRFTVKENNLYATCLGWPGGQVTIDTLKCLYPAEIRSVRMLGVERNLIWSLSEAGLSIELPAERPCEHAYVFKIERGWPYDQVSSFQNLRGTTPDWWKSPPEEV
jgi:alpha-L-fucosidase